MKFLERLVILFVRIIIAGPTQGQREWRRKKTRHSEPDGYVPYEGTMEERIKDDSGVFSFRSLQSKHK